MPLDKKDLPEDVKSVIEKFTASRSGRQFYEERWLKNYALAHNYRKKSAYPYRSNIVIPTIFSNIHDQLPRIEAAIFGGDPIVTATPIDAVAIDNVENVEDVWTWDFLRARVRQKTVSWVLQYLIFGDAFIKPRYRLDIDKRAGRIVYDGPEFDVLNIWSAYFDPAATSTQPPNYWIHRKIYTSKKQFQREAQLLGYKNVDDIPSFSGDDDYRADVLSYINMGYNNADALKDAVEVLEFHDSVDRTVTTVVNREILAKETTPEVFEGAQIIQIGNYEQPMQFYHKGEPEIMEGMFHGLNTTVNQDIDNSEIFNNQALLVEEGALSDERQNIMRPGARIWVKPGRIGSVAEAPFRQVAFSGMREREQQFMNWMRMAVVGEHALSAPGQKKTATETDYIANKETGRLTLKIQLIEYFGIKEIAIVDLDMVKKMIGAGKIIVKKDEATGQKYASVLREQDLAGQFDPEPMGSKAAASQERELEQAGLVLNAVKGVPFINQKEAYKDFLKAAGRKDVGRYFDLTDMQQAPAALPQPGNPEQMAGVQ